MSRFWSPVVHNLLPYVPGEQPQIIGQIKLNTNENPYGPSSAVRSAILDAVNSDLRLYPDPSALELRRAIAESYRLSAEEVFVGNGSDEVLAHVFQGLLNHNKPLLFPDVTYSFYRTYCRLYSVSFKEVPVDAQLRIDLNDCRQECGAIILANPNAPTGIALPVEDIERLLTDHSDQVVVIDEAYVDFGGETAVPLIPKYENLLVVQTFSKSRSLAGLRVGFAMGQRPLIEALERVKDSFNSYPVDRLALAGALASWRDQTYFERHLEMLLTSRERLASMLRSLDFEVLPSAANFLFVRHKQKNAEWLAQMLRLRLILVRHFSGGRTHNYLRISVGTNKECEALVKTLKELLR